MTCENCFYARPTLNEETIAIIKKQLEYFEERIDEYEKEMEEYKKHSGKLFNMKPLPYFPYHIIAMKRQWLGELIDNDECIRCHRYPESQIKRKESFCGEYKDARA